MTTRTIRILFDDSLVLCGDTLPAPRCMTLEAMMLLCIVLRCACRIAIGTLPWSWRRRWRWMLHFSLRGTCPGSRHHLPVVRILEVQDSRSLETRQITHIRLSGACLCIGERCASLVCAQEIAQSLMTYEGSPLDEDHRRYTAGPEG